MNLTKIRQTLMDRDKLTLDQAEAKIQTALEELGLLLAAGEVQDPKEQLTTHFNLNPNTTNKERN